MERNLIAESGVATITVAGEEISVWCDMDTLGGGWTVLQRRGDFGKPKNFFLKKWDDYKQGFGDPKEVLDEIVNIQPKGSRVTIIGPLDWTSVLEQHYSHETSTAADRAGGLGREQDAGGRQQLHHRHRVLQVGH